MSEGVFLGSLFYSTDLCVCFMPVPYCFDYYSLVVQFQVWEHDTSGFILFSQDCFGYLGTFVVPYKFQGYLLQFCEKYHWHFERDCIEFVDFFGQYDILILTLPIHEHQYMSISFYLFMLFSISFLNVFYRVQVFYLLSQIYSWISYSFLVQL